jgi:pimeloyl-ACP methyl ester carboxylesterase
MGGVRTPLVLLLSERVADRRPRPLRARESDNGEQSPAGSELKCRTSPRTRLAGSRRSRSRRSTRIFPLSIRVSVCTETAQLAGNCSCDLGGLRRRDCFGDVAMSAKQRRHAAARRSLFLEAAPALRARSPRVSAITHPVFIANGDSDPMILPQYSYLLAGLIPPSKLKIYADAAHGFLFQHAAEFAADVEAFLNE